MLEDLKKINKDKYKENFKKEEVDFDLEYSKEVKKENINTQESVGQKSTADKLITEVDKQMSEKLIIDRSMVDSSTADNFSEYKIEDEINKTPELKGGEEVRSFDRVQDIDKPEKPEKAEKSEKSEKSEKEEKEGEPGKEGKIKKAGEAGGAEEGQDLEGVEKEEDEELEVGEIIVKPNFSEKVKGFFSKKMKNNLDLLKTDLIKDEIEIQFDWSSHLASFLLLFIIAFIIVAESCVFFRWWGEDKEFQGTNYLEEEIAYINQEIERIKPEYDEAMLFADRLKLSVGSLDRHIYWTNFFTLLEANTLKNIYYRNFSGDIYGNYVLPAVSNNVLAINYQSKVFSASDMVLSTEVSDENIINTVDSEGTERSVINFNFNLNLSNKIFKY